MSRDRYTLAQWYCLAGGLALLLAGILGFLSDSSFDAGAGLQGKSFLGFEVNGWHNVVHVLSGLLLLSAFARRGPARAVALGFGLVYGAVAVIGLIDGDDVLGLIPVNPADNVLHVLLAGLGLLLGAISPGTSRGRDAGERTKPAREPRGAGRPAGMWQSTGERFSTAAEREAGVTPGRHPGVGRGGR